MSYWRFPLISFVFSDPLSLLYVGLFEVGIMMVAFYCFGLKSFFGFAFYLFYGGNWLFGFLFLVPARFLVFLTRHRVLLLVFGPSAIEKQLRVMTLRFFFLLPFMMFVLAISGPVVPSPKISVPFASKIVVIFLFVPLPVVFVPVSIVFSPLPSIAAVFVCLSIVGSTLLVIIVTRSSLIRMAVLSALPEVRRPVSRALLLY